MPTEAVRHHGDDDVLGAALGYLKRGWRVVPVAAHGKKPFNPDRPGGGDWQKLRGDEGDVQRWFANSELNIGVLLGAPSGGLVDIDLDGPEAIGLAPRFLPKTGAAFGREGKPESHWLYVAPGAATRKFVDSVNNAMLVEVRSTGAQTVFPPSIHESGEAIDWTVDIGPTEIPQEQLLANVSRLAAAALFARHWPGEGARHEAQLTLSGYLVRGGWSIEQVAWFTAHVVGAAGGDPDLAKRLATARDAAQRFADGRSLRGYPKLVESFGDKVARTASSWLGISEPIGTASSPGDPCDQRELALGSQVEIAYAIAEDLQERHGGVVHCEGRFWVWARTHWRALTDAELRRETHRCDGAFCRAHGERPRRVRLTKGAIDGVLGEMAALLEGPDFFEASLQGVNCVSGFLIVSPDGGVEQIPHEPSHRRRHALRGKWSPEASADPPAGSLLGIYLDRTCGEGPDAKAISTLLAEIAGAAALGIGARIGQPKAIVLVGPTNAGKSAFLEILRGMVSPEACASVNPRRFCDDRHLVQLAGKLLNAADELGGEAIVSDLFKQVVTGERVIARDVFKSATTFRPQALNVFACNELPYFKHGIDSGVRRRLLVIPMSRSLSEEERIADIGRRITEEEPDLLLAWAVGGARRLLERGSFTIPPACDASLREWANAADPVAAWLHDPDEVEFVEGARVRTKTAYRAFCHWAPSEGYTVVPPHGRFTQRALALSERRFAYARASDGAYFLGLKLRRERFRE